MDPGGGMRFVVMSVALLFTLGVCAGAAKRPGRIVGADGAEMVLVPAGEFAMGTVVEGPPLA